MADLEPGPDLPEDIFLGATWGSPRRDHPGPVWLRPAPAGDGSFLRSPTGETIEVGGRTLHVYDYRVDRDGTHAALGPVELEKLGLRKEVPAPDARGDMPGAYEVPDPPSPTRRGAYVSGHITNQLPGFTAIYNPNIGGVYANDGPSSIILHMTVSHSLSASYVARHPYPPQFWANPYTTDLWQTGDPAQPGRALYQGWGPWTNRKGFLLQTELVGVPEVNVQTYTRAQYTWIAQNVVVPQAQWLASIGRPVNLTQVAYHADSSGSASEYWHGRMSPGQWDGWNGLAAHIDAPDNDHWDCSVEDTRFIASEAIRILGGGAGIAPPPIDEEDDEMMRIVYQVGGGGKHGPGTVWAISSTEPKAWPISNGYTVQVLQAHGVLMTKDQMRAKAYTYETDGNSITSTYEVMPILETIPDK